MLVLKIPARHVWDPNREEFLYIRETTLRLEHSLLSLAKWESKWHIPFFSSGGTSLLLLLCEMGVLLSVSRAGNARIRAQQQQSQRELRERLRGGAPSGRTVYRRPQAQ